MEENVLGMKEDDSMIDSDDGWAGTGEGSDSRKRAADGGDRSDGRPSNRRRIVSDEAAMRIMLTIGWRRETLIRDIGKSGVRGEVTHFSPSGRRFRQYPDVIRYLELQAFGISRRIISVSALDTSLVNSSSRWKNLQIHAGSVLENRKYAIWWIRFVLLEDGSLAPARWMRRIIRKPLAAIFRGNPKELLNLLKPKKPSGRPKR